MGGIRRDAVTNKAVNIRATQTIINIKSKFALAKNMCMTRRGKQCMDPCNDTAKCCMQDCASPAGFVGEKVTECVIEGSTECLQAVVTPSVTTCVGAALQAEGQVCVGEAITAQVTACIQGGGDVATCSAAGQQCGASLASGAAAGCEPATLQAAGACTAAGTACGAFLAG
jgi:hypothetical protein